MSNLWKAVLLEIAYHGYLLEYRFRDIPGRRYHFATGEGSGHDRQMYYASILVEFQR